MSNYTDDDMGQRFNISNLSNVVGSASPCPKKIVWNLPDTLVSPVRLSRETETACRAVPQRYLQIRMFEGSSSAEATGAFDREVPFG